MYICYTAFVCKELRSVRHATLSAPVAPIGKSVQAVCEVGFWFKKFTFEVTLECTDGAKWNDTLQDCTGTFYLYSIISYHLWNETAIYLIS